MRMFFFEGMEKLALIEPLAMLFIQDQLRGSPLFLYAGVLDATLIEEHPGVAVFAHGGDDVSGCLFETDREPGFGALLYFSVPGRIDEAVRLATEAGGSVEEPVTAIGEYGRRAVVVDPDGNRIALHDA